MMAGQPCDVCYRWVVESIGKHNARHIADNPHTFCRTIRCGDDCPVPPTPMRKRKRGCIATEPLCSSCGHAAHWRECRAIPEPVGCACRHRGPHSDAPLTEEQRTTRAGRAWPVEGNR